MEASNDRTFFIYNFSPERYLDPSSPLLPSRLGYSLSLGCATTFTVQENAIFKPNKIGNKIGCSFCTITNFYLKYRENGANVKCLYIRYLLFKGKTPLGHNGLTKKKKRIKKHEIKHPNAQIVSDSEKTNISQERTDKKDKNKVTEILNPYSLH